MYVRRMQRVAPEAIEAILNWIEAIEAILNHLLLQVAAC
jgi:hypothetical protein